MIKCMKKLLKCVSMPVLITVVLFCDYARKTRTRAPRSSKILFPGYFLPDQKSPKRAAPVKHPIPEVLDALPEVLDVQ